MKHFIGLLRPMMMRNRDNSNSRWRAYTLVEIAIAVAVIAMMAAIALPRYSSATDSYRAEMAARRVCADLTLARQQAIATSSAVTVSFSPASSSYTIAISGVSNNPMPVVLSADPFDCGLEASFAGTLAVSFDAYGSASNGGQIAITCHNANRIINVEQTTGKATIQ